MPPPRSEEGLLKGRPSSISFLTHAFNRFAVDYAVIGAFAAIAQAVPIPPIMDIDFYASLEKINLVRPANALEFLDGTIRVNDLDEGTGFDRSPEFLGKIQMLNLTCEFGEFDALLAAEHRFMKSLTLTTSPNPVNAVMLGA